MEPITRKSIGIDGEVFEDRRSEPRHRVLKGGVLIFNNGYGVLDCVVRNMSDHGARLAFGDTTAVPSRFALRISDEDRPRKARACWRTQTDVGIEFDTAGQDDASAA